jgi:hypothetical protein
MKSLDDILKEMPSLVNRKIELSLWIDTYNLTPIIRTIEVRFLIPQENIFSILKLIDAYYPITSIRDLLTGTVYHITRTEEFMKKPCEGCQ